MDRPQDMETWFYAKVRKLNDRIANELEELAADGQELLQGYIETRGTANPEYGGKTAWKRTYYKTGKGSKSGPSKGRVWGGEMRADIEQSFTRSTDVMVASFGWIDNVEDYYKLQELGFDHEATGEHIQGMFIMSDAYEWTKEEIKKRLNRVARDF